MIWHITHRCHKKEHLLKFARDRSRWHYWLFEAKKRYGLRVLNYASTSNHIHLLVWDDRPQSKGTISASLDLIAGRTAQEFNDRKGRLGAFWQDRYHATAIEADAHLFRCMAYIDLNMVRAGVVIHPKEWKYCGYNEIVGTRKRRLVIDWPSLMILFNMNDRAEIGQYYSLLIEGLLQTGQLRREPIWTESIAVGNQSFVEQTAKALRSRSKRRIVRAASQTDLNKKIKTWVIKESQMRYRRFSAIK
jgi:putative transposase